MKSVTSASLLSLFAASSIIATSAMAEPCATKVSASVQKASHSVDDNSDITLVNVTGENLIYITNVFPQYSDGASTEEFPMVSYATVATGSESQCRVQKSIELPARDCAGLAMVAAQFVDRGGRPDFLNASNAVITSRKSQDGVFTYNVTVLPEFADGGATYELPEAVYTVSAVGRSDECRVTSITQK